VYLTVPVFQSHHTALGDDELSTLRRAAAMAHTTGAVGLRLCAGDVAIADVIPHDGAGPHERARVEPGPCLCVDPCEFRLAVARAWHDHTAGRRVGLVGLDRGDALKVTWTVGPPGRLIGLGAVRARCANRSVWAFASLLAPSALAGVLTEVAAACAGPPAALDDGLAAQLIHDELLDATVVHIEVDPVDAPAAPPRVLDEVLRRMVAAAGAAEVVETLAGRGDQL
jgi:hypothetical protein